MKIDSFILTLDVLAPRFQKFSLSNQHLAEIDPDIFLGVVGSSLSDEQIILENYATQELLLSGSGTRGLIGNAASHKKMWEIVATRGRGCLIIEDDAITHKGIAGFIHDNLMVLEQNDITFFGYNTDAPLELETPEGRTLSIVTSPKYPDMDWMFSALAKTNVSNVGLYKLRASFGMLCYWISPKGAKRLGGACFPLTMETCYIPFLPHRMPAISIDRRLCSIYARSSAWMAWPPLAYTENRESLTTE